MQYGPKRSRKQLFSPDSNIRQPKAAHVKFHSIQQLFSPDSNIRQPKAAHVKFHSIQREVTRPP